MHLVSEWEEALASVSLDDYWTPELVEERMCLSVLVAASSGRLGPKSMGASWFFETASEDLDMASKIELLRQGELEERERKEAAQRNRVRRTFSAREITQADQSASWMNYLPFEHSGRGIRSGPRFILRHWIICQAFGLSWRKRCKSRGWNRDTARKRVEVALETIASRLNQDRVRVI